MKQLFLLASISVVMAQTKPVALSSFDAKAKGLLARMTLDEKIGQMTQPDQMFLKDPSDIETYFLGSVLSGGDSDPKAGNSREAWINLAAMIEGHALKTRLKIPLLYGIDAVHGHNNILGAVVFPHNIGLGATRDPALVEQIGKITAEEVRATGIQWVFAPCVTVPQDIRWGRTYEGFSEDPKLVAELGAAAVRGLQGNDLSDPHHVLACAKHYVGDGGTTMGTGGFEKHLLDQGDTRVDEATLRRIHLQGYLSTVPEGVGTIMPSYNSWNGVKVSGSKHLLTDILKDEIGFQGFLISDYNAVDQITKDYKTAIGISINAGMDMVMVPDHYREFIKNLKELVNEGTVPMSRIDDAVTRILRVKIAMGLLDQKPSPPPSNFAFGTPEHRAVARQAVRESIVLLKNDHHTLPLRKSARIHVAGKNANDIGNQCGGWTITWQGKSSDTLPGGTTIMSALHNAGANVTTEGADVGVVVIGETPYAEGNGDRTDLSLSEQDIAAVKKMKSTGVPVVVIVISGRPLILDPILDQADAILAAWLPGTEGEGVTDVLLGAYKPTGKLSFTWPSQFKYGFGLSY
ncbi:MAG TPA: glycoside hydrolase family 3 N-terminal domain-containing protein [Bryobacteraceae bacterium]|jgi:beta-glucosidase|nr:glycoside hydrolase family 3 N-terminal domain-containing protein [Bryobacteraceae bacterium]